MRIAYLDCLSGISGDMTLAALVDAGVPLADVQAGLDSLGIAGLRLETSEVKKKGFRALKLTIHHEPEHAHRHVHHITEMIDRSALTEPQKLLAKSIFVRLGEAEAKVHGTTIRKVHFHEVGAVDSIADIVGSAIGWDLLRVDRVVASPVPTGHGFIEIAHGRCSIPAPATAELLAGIPLAASDIEAELTTPTGAAILSTLVQSFGPVPPMTIERIGYGAGERDLESQPNLLRLLVGQTGGGPAAGEQLWIVETNLDDASGELVGYCIERLWEAGALDVYTTSIQMKKNRPGVVLTALCEPMAVEQIEAILFAETTTLGVRRWPVSRRKLERQAHTVATPWGPVEGKLAILPGRSPTFSPEYESCRRVAIGHRVPLRIVMEAARSAFEAAGLVARNVVE
ncbi:MAG: nickel pincer cofactor biosynthesis protein LarC [Pirellulales bacterium]